MHINGLKKVESYLEGLAEPHHDQLDLLGEYMKKYIDTRVDDWKDYFYIRDMGILPIRQGAIRMSFEEWKKMNTYRRGSVRENKK